MSRPGRFGCQLPQHCNKILSFLVTLAGLCVEATIVSPLVDFLLEASVHAPLKIGLRLFWALRIEHQVGSLRGRGLCILDHFLKYLGNGLLASQFEDQV